jgi:hypothetical protein
MTIEEMRTIDGLKTYKELEEAKERIKRLEHEVQLLREHTDCRDVWLVDAILKGKAMEE